jgi:hypothetical protein
MVGEGQAMVEGIDGGACGRRPTIVLTAIDRKRLRSLVDASSMAEHRQVSARGTRSGA